MARPLVIDLFAGVGGWTAGFLAEGYDAIGFDIERHQYGDKRYPSQLVLQDVLTLDGAQFRGASAIVASPPCQAYSYMAIAKTHFGSYYLWGDVESVGGGIVAPRPRFGETLRAASRRMKHNPDGTNHPTGSWFGIADSVNRGAREGLKVEGFNFHDHEKGLPGRDGGCVTRCYNSKSSARKAASAMIAEIPFALASHIARCVKP